MQQMQRTCTTIYKSMCLHVAALDLGASPRREEQTSLKNTKISESVHVVVACLIDHMVVQGGYLAFRRACLEYLLRQNRSGSQTTVVQAEQSEEGKIWLLAPSFAVSSALPPRLHLMR